MAFLFLEDILTDYFSTDALLRNSFPAVQYIAEKMKLSPNYLSALLKMLTGKSTQQHLHDKLIDKAKEKLSITKETPTLLKWQNSSAPE